MHPKAQENMSKLLECAHQISAQFKCGVFHEFSQQSLRGSSKFAARVCNDNTATTQLALFPAVGERFSYSLGMRLLHSWNTQHIVDGARPSILSKVGLQPGYNLS